MFIPFSQRRPSFQDRCAHYGGAILRLVKECPAGRTKTIVAEQLSKSATSIGANASEARSAESRADFIHKMQIALKEARESFYWLQVLEGSGEMDSAAISPWLTECDELIAIMVASVQTAKRNREEKVERYEKQERERERERERE